MACTTRGIHVPEGCRLRVRTAQQPSDMLYEADIDMLHSKIQREGCLVCVCVVCAL